MNYIREILFSLFLIMCFCILNTLQLFAAGSSISRNSTGAVSGKVKISFVYSRQSGIASNQFAVWIEDAGGKYIKTLFVTRFTAKGGWTYRPESIPSWIKAAHLASLTDGQIDSITGATPSSGNLTYFWDCRDYNNETVPAGEYRYCVEGTLRWKNRVLYTGVIKTGGPAQRSKAKSEFSGDSTEGRDMITNVSGEYYP